MRKFGFSIRTQGGSLVENLVIQGRDLAEAERKLRQIYHRCTIEQTRELGEALPHEASDFEGLISLIAAQPDEPDPKR